MLDLEQEVILKWNGKIKEHYILNDYIFTKINDLFSVKVKHLTDGASVDVVVKCDYCGEFYTTSWKHYIRNKKRNEVNKKDSCKNNKCVQSKMKETSLIKYKNAINNGEDYKLKFYWNDELINKLKMIYPIYTTNEIIKYFDEFKNLSREQIDKKSFELDFKNSDFIKYFINGLDILPIDYIERINFKSEFDILDRKINKFCIRCGRILPNNVSYFPQDKDCLDGFRCICRECGKDGHFMEENYIPKKWWTKEDNELLRVIYPYFTNSEIISLYFPNETLKSLSDKAFVLGKINKTQETKMRINKEKSENYCGEKSWSYGRKHTEETKQKMSEIKKIQYENGDIISPWLGRLVSNEERKRISERVKGKWAGKNNPRVLKPLKGCLNGRWLGGIKELYKDLRDHLQIWKKDSMESCSYKCAITGLNFDNIHHLYPFKNIINELFENLNIEQKHRIGDYDEIEVDKIYKELCRLHDYYGLGICLSKDIHKCFHNNYGYNDFNICDFEDFKNKYFKGNFDEELSEEMKSYNSIKRLEENNKLKEAI